MSFYLLFKKKATMTPLQKLSFEIFSVLYDPKEQPKADSSVIRTTPYQHSANVNNSSITGDNIFITYRLAEANADCNTLTVVDICVIIASKVISIDNVFCIFNSLCPCWHLCTCVCFCVCCELLMWKYRTNLRQTWLFWNWVSNVDDESDWTVWF